MSPESHILKNSQETMLQEFAFLHENKMAMLRSINSNRPGISSQYKKLAKLANDGLKEVEDLIEFDLTLNKLNAYIAIAHLNAVEDNDLELRYLTRIPSLLFKMHLNKLKILKTLKISGNTNKLSFIPPEIGLMPNLINLEISNCLLKKVPREIGNLRNLQSLNLEGNCFSTLPKEISELTLLKELNLSNNPMLIELPEELGNLSALEILSAHHDHIQRLPTSVKQMQSLREMNLDYNDLKALPNELAELSHLETLKLRHNQLKELPRLLLKLNALKHLDIQENDALILPSEFSHLIH